MAFIAEASDERPKGQVISTEHGYTVAMCPSLEWAHQVAAAMNNDERRKRAAQNISQYDDTRMEEP